MRLKSLSIACLAFVAASAHAAIQLPTPEIETLPNGLKLAWFVSDSLPVVDLALLVQSGTRDDGHGKSGTAELAAMALDRGCGDMSAQQFAHAVEMLGASRYISSDDDTFTLGMHGLAPDAGRLLELLSWVAIKPTFAEAEIKREHERLLDRWSHLPDYGETLVALAFRRQLTARTSYNRSGFVSQAEFKAVGRKDVVEYHRKHFTPKNSVLMVVGRVDKTAFRAQVLKLMGTPAAWSGDAPVASKRRDYWDKRLPAPKAGTVLVVDRPGLTQAEVRMGFRAPLVNAPEHYALTVANALLGEYFNSRLNLLIRDKLGLTYGIGSSFGYNQDLAVFTIGAATRNEAVGKLIRETQKVLKALTEGTIPVEEVRMAQDYLIGGFPLSVSTLGSVAARWLSGYVFGLGTGYLNEFVPKVGAVTTDEVASAVRKDLKPEQLVIVVAGDALAIGKALKEAGLAYVKVGVRELM